MALWCTSAYNTFLGNAAQFTKSPFDWDKTGRMHVVVYYLKGVIIIPLILQEIYIFSST